MAGGGELWGCKPPVKLIPVALCTVGCSHDCRLAAHLPQVLLDKLHARARTHRLSTQPLLPEEIAVLIEQ